MAQDQKYKFVKMNHSPNNHNSLHSLSLENVEILNSIFSSAVEGLIIIDHRGIIQNANPATCKLFEYDEDELLGQNVNVLMPSDVSAQHDDYISTYLNTRIPKIIGNGREVIAKKKFGDMFSIWLSVSEIKLEDRTLFTGFIHDLSQVKSVENKLKMLNDDLELKVTERTYKLEDAVNRLLSTNKKLTDEISSRKAIQQELKNREEELKKSLVKEKELGELKTRFVSMASHEFRTPLATILSSVNLIQKYDQSEQQEKREKHIHKIKSTVGHLVSILNDFLSMNKLEEGIVQVSIDNFNVLDVIYETVEEMKTIMKSGQNIAVINDAIHPIIKNDQRVLKNILINLISNAAKYSGDHGHIKCLITDNDSTITIGIEDNGIGIPQKDQLYLFERFFRAANAMNIEGTGLGLNIVKRYLEMVHGEIQFESVPNERTIFEVTLPKDFPTATK